MNEQRPDPTFRLEEIAGGAVAARIDEAMEAVARSIDDPNTEATAARKLVVTLTFKPSKTRSSAEVAIDVQTKLPGRAPLATSAFVGYRPCDRRFLVREQNPQQEPLRFPADPTGGRPAKGEEDPS